ncbi:MAG: oxidoreductase [Legionella sp.]|nr:MAG: oxidoreductase [Legionella sp.]
MLTVNIIGTGAVGQTLGHLFATHQIATILGVTSRSEANAKVAIQFIGQGAYYASASELPHADVTVIATPDHAFATIIPQLMHNTLFQPGAIVVHCSGALTSDDLAQLRDRDIAVASIHPMMSFKQPRVSVNQFIHIPCALEGDESTLRKVTALFTAIGGSVYSIHKDKKALYHVAAVFASNYQITLAQQAQQCLLASGLSEQHARQVVTVIMQSVVDNIRHSSEPKDALTGPIQRGDSIAIQQHLKALSDDQRLRDLYCVLGRATLPLTHLKEESLQQIASLLESCA